MGLILLIIILLMLFGGGYGGYAHNWRPGYGIGSIGFILLFVLLMLILFGRLSWW